MEGAEGRSAWEGVRWACVSERLFRQQPVGTAAGHSGESREPQGLGVIMEEDRSLSQDRASGLRDLQGIGTGLYIYVMPFL